jgi:hypothetical protein
MTIFISVVLGLFIGIIIGFFICLWFSKKLDYSGTIKVIPDEGKLIYSLELHDDPASLQNMHEVIFKVETSD